jgi:hypothetical protein
MTEVYERLDIYRQQGFTHFHHGDCVGADAEVAKLAYKLGFIIVAHPPINEKKRAFCQFNHVVLRQREYLTRNRDIVDACKILVAVPYGPEILRSGTWSTVRYARRVGRTVDLIMP